MSADALQSWLWAVLAIVGLAIITLITRAFFMLPERELPLPDHAILGCLEGRRYNNVRKNVTVGRKRLQYFATGRPILDAEGGVTGAVEIAKDAQEIRDLAKSIYEPADVGFSDIIGASARGLAPWVISAARTAAPAGRSGRKTAKDRCPAPG